ncbi:MAG: hypothetical protein SFV17_19265 [Candidatus Obscuribacter sp.]|nr:hypothetical protein [Candidatus Obscuribacter sp.]
MLVKYMLSAERVKASLNEAIGSIPSLQEAKSKSGVSIFDEKWRLLKESVSELRQLERSLSKAERKNFGLVRSLSDCMEAIHSATSVAPSALDFKSLMVSRDLYLVFADQTKSLRDSVRPQLESENVTDLTEFILFYLDVAAIEDSLSKAASSLSRYFATKDDKEKLLFLDCAASVKAARERLQKYSRNRFSSKHFKAYCKALDSQQTEFETVLSLVCDKTNARRRSDERHVIQRVGPSPVIVAKVNILNDLSQRFSQL